MYTKPQIVKFGTFRDLTSFGFTSAADGASVLGNGCQIWIFEFGCPTDADGQPTVS